MKRVHTVIAGASLLAAGAGIAFAQTQPAPAASELTAAAIIQQLEGQGYTRIEDVERDDGHWEVEATKADGMRVELHLDLTDGRILHEERDDD